MGWWNNNWFVSIVVTFIFALGGYWYSNYDIFPRIRAMSESIDYIRAATDNNTKSIEGIKNNYLAKDTDGSEILVGINSELKGNEISVYKNNKLNLKYGDSVFISNTVVDFAPTIRFLVKQENDKNGSTAEIFISHDGAKYLGITDLSQGVYRLRKVCEKDSNNVVMTDEFKGYNILEKENIMHLRVDHQQMFSDGFVHTNNIESFWATLKRGVYGIYHHVSVKYMQRYVDEFCFRYNNRKKDIFNIVLSQSILKQEGVANHA